MSVSLHRRCTGVAVSLALAFLPLCSSTFAAGPESGKGILQGKVVAEDGVSPMEGVVVHLAVRDGGADYSSSPTNSEGVFRLDAAPAGDYAVLAETGQGAYLASDSIHLSAGENRPVALRIQTRAGTAPAQSGGGKLPTWGKIVIVGTLALAAYAVIDDTQDDSEPNATPF